MKLYSGPLSLFTQKVRIALAEKQLAYERIEVGWSRSDRYLPHHPDVVALNPKRQVPVLVDGELALYDSTLILEYLEDRYPERPLLPKEPAQRARCRQQEAAADEIWFPHVWTLIEERFYPPPADGSDTGRAAQATAELGTLYADFDRALAGRDWYGDAYGVADIGTFVMAQAAGILGAPPPQELRNVSAWLQRMQARPPVATEIEATTAFLARTLAA
jgi:glutathione S-transferase